MQSVAIAGLIEIQFPTGNVHLCDGGLIKWGATTFKAKHPVFGTVASIDPLGDGIGDEVPALELVLLPLGAPAQLSQPGFQSSRARFWIAEYDPATSAVVGTPDLQFDGQVDQTTLSVGRSERRLSISIVSILERLFEGNIGNSLNPIWHKSIWPGETGHDNATGLVRDLAWATEKPNQGGGGFMGKLLTHRDKLFGKALGK